MSTITSTNLVTDWAQCAMFLGRVREAIDRARSASIDRIWYDGYPGDFTLENGPRWVFLAVAFPQVAAVEALRVAELDTTTAGSTPCPSK
ncbi:hypothetical protein LHJ74_07730 [Streptomyces sp. N2-109]|uniref:Uncharacterized protein n=1 Tax=Streptomyces gossypii TaxID=2883101 RepID=A0ABT2JQP1_9ACTN|nr:hypothetical protein [Streptomyces gossypii]MCT2589804.1 hypothetical protein [Streptomyces gossypii]